MTDVQVRPSSTEQTAFGLVFADADIPRLSAEPGLHPFIKWPGGKFQELRLIAAAAPALLGRVIDPFVGGGAVLLAAPAEVPAWGNDICPELIGIYDAAAHDDGLLGAALGGLGDAWERLTDLGDLYADLARSFAGEETVRPETTLARHQGTLTAAVEPGGVDLTKLIRARVVRDLEGKLDRMKRVETRVGLQLNESDLLANIECAVRATFYYAVRSRYNIARAGARLDAERLADFFFLREFAYAAMFRFNAADGFNVPYGGLTYNRKSLAAKTRLLFSSRMVERLRATEWRCTDFELFLKEASPSRDDFVFIDPPYDSDFSSYDNRPFGSFDQVRLHDTLAELKANVMVVIKDTPMIRRLYAGSNWHTAEARKTYMWTIKSRNDREANHLVITNY